MLLVKHHPNFAPFCRYRTGGSRTSVPSTRCAYMTAGLSVRWRCKIARRESNPELNVTNTLKHCHVAAWSVNLQKQAVKVYATGDKEVGHFLEEVDKTIVTPLDAITS